MYKKNQGNNSFIRWVFMTMFVMRAMAGYIPDQNKSMIYDLSTWSFLDIPENARMVQTYSYDNTYTVIDELFKFLWGFSF